MDTKMRMLTDQVQAVEAERRAGNSRLDAKQAEVELLKQELHSALSRVNQQATYMHK